MRAALTSAGHCLRWREIRSQRQCFAHQLCRVVDTTVRRLRFEGEGRESPFWVAGLPAACCPAVVREAVPLETSSRLAILQFATQLLIPMSFASKDRSGRATRWNVSVRRERWAR